MPANAPQIPAVGLALGRGREKFTKIDVPVLAIYADPHSFGTLYHDDPQKLDDLVENDKENTSAQANAFQAGVPGARVVRIPNANHLIFQFNEAEVVRDMTAFIATLR